MFEDLDMRRHQSEYDVRFRDWVDWSASRNRLGDSKDSISDVSESHVDIMVGRGG